MHDNNIDFDSLNFWSRLSYLETFDYLICIALFMYISIFYKIILGYIISIFKPLENIINSPFIKLKLIINKWINYLIEFKISSYKKKLNRDKYILMSALPLLQPNKTNNPDSLENSLFANKLNDELTTLRIVLAKLDAKGPLMNDFSRTQVFGPWINSQLKKINESNNLAYEKNKENISILPEELSQNYKIHYLSLEYIKKREFIPRANSNLPDLSVHILGQKTYLYSQPESPDVPVPVIVKQRSIVLANNDIVDISNRTGISEKKIMQKIRSPDLTQEILNFIEP